MRQVVQIPRTGEVQVAECPPPQLRPGGALVLTHASLISAGTERSKLEMGRASLVGKARARPDLARQVVIKARQDGLRETYRTVATRLTTPVPLGYSSSGTVLEVAPDCIGIAAGDLVACAGGEYANHAEVNYVPQNLIARVPEGMTALQAAYGTLGAIALHSLRRASVSIGDRVAVIGLGLVGLLAVQLARAAGGRVLAIDLDSTACELAARLGAERAVPRAGSVEAAADEFTNGRGVDAVLVCAATSSNDPIELASALCRDRGRVVVLGSVGLDIPRASFYEKELDLGLSRSYGPGRYDASYEERGHDYPFGYVRWTEQRNIAEFLRLVQQKLVDVDALTTHRFPIEQAPEAYALISERRSVSGEPRPVGVLLEYAADPELASPATIEIAAPRRPTGGQTVGVGLIGAGSFATRILIPALRSDERVGLVAVCTSSGVTATHVARRFGFARATSDAEGLAANGDIGAVVIATRHDSHAELAAAALRAGKAVFCEKPLASSWPDLEEVAAAYRDRPAPLFVGFNRRFSPLVQQLRDALPQAVPRAITCRINAGPITPGHWLNDPIAGGGRIVGEFCHFLDLAHHLAEARPVRVSAEGVGSDRAQSLPETVIVQVMFANGSVASLQYLANGDVAFRKERLEVFSGGVVAVIDDFRSLEVILNGKRRVHRLRRQEKGHREELRAFIDAAAGAALTVQTPDDVFWSSALTLQVPVALASGRPAAIELPRALGGSGANAIAPPDPRPSPPPERLSDVET